MENISVGDKVKITDYYKDNYPNWKITEAIVVELGNKQKINAKSLAKEQKSVYVSFYGEKDVYEAQEMIIRVNDINYVVSDLGFRK